MSGDLVLITGASGHLGFRVLVTALQAGYRVRAPVRRPAQIDAIKATKSVQPFLENLELIIVPDILKDGAYDDALSGVTGVIHCASPLAIPTDDYNRDIIVPAIRGTVGILNSALKVPTVKRVVITSSISAIISWEDFALRQPTKVFTDRDTVSKPTGPYANSFEAYSASKVIARHATDDFVATNHPAFDIINIMPSFIIGKNELISDFKDIESGTNIFALAAIRGYINPPTSGLTVHVNDVANVHVLALDNKTLKRQDTPIYDHFLISSGGLNGTNFNDSIEIVKENFQTQVKQGLFPLNGNQGSKKIMIDSERTENVFGVKLAGFEEQVKSVVEHYIELAHAAGVKTAQDIVKK